MKMNVNKMNSILRKLYSMGLILTGIVLFINANIPNNTNVSNEEVNFSTATFDKSVLKSSKLVVVDFWATWCGPCRMAAPIVKSMADKYNGKAVIGKLDVDKNQEISNRYKVTAIPTILFFKNGKIVDKIVGLPTKEELENKIKLNM